MDNINTAHYMHMNEILHNKMFIILLKILCNYNIQVFLQRKICKLQEKRKWCKLHLKTRLHLFSFNLIFIILNKLLRVLCLFLCYLLLSIAHMEAIFFLFHLLLAYIHISYHIFFFLLLLPKYCVEKT